MYKHFLSSFFSKDNDMWQPSRTGLAYKANKLDMYVKTNYLIFILPSEIFENQFSLANKTNLKLDILYNTGG